MQLYENSIISEQPLKISCRPENEFFIVDESSANESYELICAISDLRFIDHPFEREHLFPT